jgi:hypothetical protein
MASKTQSVFTSTFVNTTFTISETMGFTIVSINLLSGAATILGSTQIPGLTVTTAALTVGLPVLLTANPSYTLDGIVINSSAGGTFEVIAK